MTESELPELDDDLELDALQAEAAAKGWRGHYLRDMGGEVRWYEAPCRSRCGGHGYTNCYCGGDLCVCGNQGWIECYGCEDCEPLYGDEGGDSDE